SEHQVLYIADDNEIRSLYPFNPNSAYEQAFQGDETVRIDAMDAYVKGNTIFWTNWHTGRICYRDLSAPASASSNRNRREVNTGVVELDVSVRPPVTHPLGSLSRGGVGGGGVSWW
ncbi:hypothetical protein chiPu_0032225, partial [Chiloscyllium punctatum]|nr:hypothetical protein [Chiloscyllium punctatum]